MTDQPDADDRTPDLRLDADKSRGPFVRPVVKPTGTSTSDKRD